MTLVMFVGFLLIVIRAYARGSTDDCGCFGTLTHTPIGTKLIARNIVLVAAGLVLVVLASGRGSGGAVYTLTSHDGWNLVGMLALCALVALLTFTSISTTDARQAPRGGEIVRRESSQGWSDNFGFLDGGELRVLDPRAQAQARSRAQLLLFIKDGCTPCSETLELATSLAATLRRVVDITLVMTVGLAEAIDTQPREHHGFPVLLDVAGRSGYGLSGSAHRPFGVLIGADGAVVEPFASGQSELRDLLETLAHVAVQSA